MTVTYDRIRRDLLALLGESPGLSPILEEGEESGVLTLEEQLMVLLPSVAVEATLATPRLQLDEIEKASPQIEWNATGTAARIPLPADYLKFYSLRMAGWDRAVTEPEKPGTLREGLGAGCPSWMACAENPLVIEGRGDSGRFLTVVGIEGRPDGVEELLYVPLPRLTEKKLRISGAAYPVMLRLLVSRVSS